MQPEQWEQRWKDYYLILGIAPDASEADTRDAFRYKAHILHPDRLSTAPPRLRQRAERDFKDVVEAYEVLRDPRRRQAYHRSWHSRQRPSEAPPRRFDARDAGDVQPAPAGPPPRPVLDPPVLRFTGLSPSGVRQASFTVTNAGGPWSKLRFRRSPAPWLTLVRRRPVGRAGDLLPLRVDVEIDASQMPPEARLVAGIEVWLDGHMARLPIAVQTVAPPQPARAARYQSPRRNRRAHTAGIGSTPLAGLTAPLRFWMAIFLCAWAVTLCAFAVQAIFPSPQTGRLGETTLEWLAMASLLGLTIWAFRARRQQA